MTPYFPVLKAILPYLKPLVSAAAPYFTKGSEKSSSEQSLQEKQIAELQVEVKNNAESLQTLATQLQQTITAFDERELNDQKSFVSVNDALKSLTEQNEMLKNALQKSIKDAQITKYIALSCLFASLVTIISVFLK